MADTSLSAGMTDGDDRDARATALARRRIAYVLVGVVVVLTSADVILPQQQFAIDPITLGTIVAAMLLLLGIDVRDRFLR